MSWVFFEDDRQRAWRLNQEGLWLLCQQLAYAQLMYERARVVAEESPFFWIGPDLHNVEFDFRGLREARVERARDYHHEMSHAAVRDAAAAFQQLVAMKDEADLLTRRVKEMKRRVAYDNADCIERNVNWFGSATRWAKRVRDASATILVTGATFVTGGLATAGVLGAGSVLKGTATYQDTVNLQTGRRVAGAMLSAGGTFAAGLIPGIKVAGKAGKVAVVTLGMQVTAATGFATSLVQGDGMRKSLVMAMMNAGLSAVPLGDKIKAMALPMAVRFSLASTAAIEGDVLTSMAGEAVEKAAAKPPRPPMAGIRKSRVPVKELASQTDVAPSQEHLIGAMTHLDEPVTSEVYILRTAMCPA